MTVLVTYLSTLLEFVFIYITLKKFSKQSLHPGQKDIIVCLIATTILGMIPASHPVIQWVLVQILYLCYSLQFPISATTDRVLLYAITFDFLMLLQNLLAVLFSFFHLSNSISWIDVLGSAVTLFFVIILLQIPFVCDIYEKITVCPIPVKMLFINSYLVLAGLLLTLKQDDQKLYHNPFYILSVFIFIFAANICILYYEERYLNIKKTLEAYEKNLPIYDSLIQEIRSNQHEYANRLQSLQNLSQTCTDYESLASALEQYTSRYTKPLYIYPLLQINMPLFAAALYHQYTVAVSKNITIQFDVGSTRLRSKADEQKLADYACILLENAIDSHYGAMPIFVMLHSENDSIHFEVRGPVEKHIDKQQLARFFQKGYTTKNNDTNIDALISRHGYGLYYLLRDIQKYDGVVGANCLFYEDTEWAVFEFTV